jgi:D-alanyl-D-alanine carboxypeptidase
MKRLGHPLSISLVLASSTLFACSDNASDSEPYAEILSDVDFGAQLTVIESDGTTWSGAAGNATAADPMTTDHVLLVGSNTKMLTAAIVLQLVEEGALGLDDPAATWVPALRDDISIRMLLSHTSGLGEYFEHDAMTADGYDGITQAWTPSDLVDLGVAVRDEGPSNEARYANTNYIALGLVVEAVTGEVFEDVLDARIFAPLGMTSAGLLSAADPVPSEIAFGAGGELGAVTLEHPSVGWAAGSAYMSSADLARFLSAAASGELYSAAVLSEQLHPVDWREFDMPGLDGSFGLGVMLFDAQGTRIDGHLGGVTGFTGVALVDEESGTTAVLLTNQDDMAITASLAFGTMGIDLAI